MTRDGDHFRLVVAIFDEPGSLRRAIEALFKAGLSTDQLCLFARIGTLAALATAMNGAGGPGEIAFAQMLSHLEEWPGEQGKNAYAATAGVLRDNLMKLHGSSSGAGDGVVHAAQRPDFSEHIGCGAITVVVRSSTPAQQSMVTRTLLSQSSHRVKTYEFTSVS